MTTQCRSAKRHGRAMHRAIAKHRARLGVVHETASWDVWDVLWIPIDPKACGATL